MKTVCKRKLNNVMGKLKDNLYKVSNDKKQKLLVHIEELKLVSKINDNLEKLGMQNRKYVCEIISEAISDAEESIKEVI